MAKGRKTGRRRLGSLNKATVKVKAACAELVDDPDYRRSLMRRLHAGKLSPALECMIWYYAKGKPRDEVQTNETRTIFVKWQDSTEPNAPARRRSTNDLAAFRSERRQNGHGFRISRCTISDAVDGRLDTRPTYPTARIPGQRMRSSR